MSPFVRSLHFDQAPPLSIPLAFFLTAPLALAGAGGLLLRLLRCPRREKHSKRSSPRLTTVALPVSQRTTAWRPEPESRQREDARRLRINNAGVGLTVGPEHHHRRDGDADLLLAKGMDRS